ncbi:MAG: hypothetical protein ACTSU2_13560 [Promethearchaeota archaeon]
MRFFIDDAGTGDILGGAIIGIYVEEMDKYLFQRIPLEAYKEGPLLEKYPEKIVVDLVLDGLKELGFNYLKDEIFICSGNIFNRVRAKFKEKHYKFTNAVIKDPLQTLIEREYLRSLEEFGVPIENIDINAGRKRFYQLFNWICEDPYNREQYVKVGFPSWHKKWKHIALEKYLAKFKTNK